MRKLQSIRRRFSGISSHEVPCLFLSSKNIETFSMYTMFVSHQTEAQVSHHTDSQSCALQSWRRVLTRTIRLNKYLCCS
jgi:hypothetical protein